MNSSGIADPMVLTLYVSSAASARSATALITIRRICAEELAGRVVLQVVDIHSDPEALIRDQIVAIPTLIKRMPPPLRRIIGDLSNEERLRAALELAPPKQGEKEASRERATE